MEGIEDSKRSLGVSDAPFGLEPAELPTVYCGISLPASTSTDRLVADGQVVARSAPVGS